MDPSQTIAHRARRLARQACFSSLKLRQTRSSMQLTHLCAKVSTFYTNFRTFLENVKRLAAHTSGIRKLLKRGPTASSCVPKHSLRDKFCLCKAMHAKLLPFRCFRPATSLHFSEHLKTDSSDTPIIYRKPRF